MSTLANTAPARSLGINPPYPAQPVTVILPDPADLKPIYTERLILRPLDMTSDIDAEGLYRIRSRQDVASWLRAKIPDKSLADTKSWMKTKIFRTPDASGAVDSRHFYFTIRLYSDSEHIVGAMGINSLVPAPSVGYALHPDVWGRGVASEALGALVRAWYELERVGLEGNVGEERLFAATSRENMGSLGVLRKVGFEVWDGDGDARKGEEDGKRLVIMAITEGDVEV
ncbi:hypothetical protein BDW74DRAFT_177851 [Aspergillus multicolor]|uniref:GNAT family N-acetyltransferase n=1 Tax=Aspergillus multicolor TaxID=41759 RepID=UPI003CCCB683